MYRYFEPKIRERFLDIAVRNNWMLMRAAAIFCGVSQLVQIGGILLGKQKDLDSLNDRIYLWFYLGLLALSGVFLAAEQLLKRRPLVWNYRAQMVLLSLFLAWHVSFGLYDSSLFSSVGKIGMETSLVAFSALLILEPLYGLLNLAAGYGVLLVYLCVQKDLASAWSYLVLAVVSLLIFLVRIRNTRQTLLQSRKMEKMNQALEETEEKFLLTNEQYELLLQKGRLIAFEWNIPAGTVRFTREWVNAFQAPQRIENVEAYIRNAPDLQPQQREEILCCIQRAKQKQAYQKKDLLLPTKEGGERWFELQLAIQCGEDGEPALGVGLLFDIMDQKSRILALQKELSMDNFTKTLNKTALESYAMRRLHEMGPEEQVGMLVLDMDDFKKINDTYGHICGDYVLMRLGELMNRLAPPRSRVGRLGGDEFGAILDLPEGEGLAEEYAAGLVREVSKIQWKDQPLPASCSIGIGFCRYGTSFLELYSAADKALYRAKRLGKSQYCVAPLLEPGKEPGQEQDLLSRRGEE